MSEGKKVRLFSNTIPERCADAWVLPTTDSPLHRMMFADTAVKDLIKVDHFRSDDRGGYSMTPFARQTYVRLDALPESLRAEVYTYFERQLLAAEDAEARKELSEVIAKLPAETVDVPPEIDFTWDMPPANRIS